MITPPKYPSTPHWPWSESIHRDDSYHSDPEWFLNREVIITEKLDGGNTCLYNGKVYARSTNQEATAGWFAMAKKHQAWKTLNIPEFTCLYGEDLYGVHSIEYDPISEDETYRLFAVRFFKPGSDDHNKSWFADWDLIETYANQLNLLTVPVVYRGRFSTVDEITNFFRNELKKPSALGGVKEGFVMRQSETFKTFDFSKNVCKYVRPNHVQTDEHWTRNWQHCKLK